MAARAYWSGRIRLALVSIPVELYTATKSSSRISFNQIHKPSGKRIRYEKVVPGLGAVESEDIVKGYEIDKGKYVLLTDAEIDDVKLEAKKTIELVQFVDAHEIDPIYFERPFVVMPEPDDEDAGEAYSVLREALKRTKKVGLGQLVIRGQSSIVALRPADGGLMLETLRYADEVQKPNSYFRDLPKANVDKDLVGLAEELIGRKSSKFDPGAFKDSYTVALRELIDAKAEHRQVRQIEEPLQTSNVIDLMQALKRSVGKSDGKSADGKRRKSAAKTARRGPSRRSAA
ncbi:MAG: Ku protein [Xanthobacteraceae bacterium]